MFSIKPANDRFQTATIWVFVTFFGALTACPESDAVPKITARLLALDRVGPAGAVCTSTWQRKHDRYRDDDAPRQLDKQELIVAAKFAGDCVITGCARSVTRRGWSQTHRSGPAAAHEGSKGG